MSLGTLNCVVTYHLLDELTPPPSPSPPPPAQPHPAINAAPTNLNSFAFADTTTSTDAFDISRIESISDFTSTNHTAGVRPYIRDRTVTETISSFTPDITVQQKLSLSDPIITADRTVNTSHDSILQSLPPAQPLPVIAPPKKVGPRPKPAWKGSAADNDITSASAPGSGDSIAMHSSHNQFSKPSSSSESSNIPPVVLVPRSDASKKSSDSPSSSSSSRPKPREEDPELHASGSVPQDILRKIAQNQTMSKDPASSSNKSKSSRLDKPKKSSPSVRAQQPSDDFPVPPPRKHGSKDSNNPEEGSSSSGRSLVPKTWLPPSDDLPPSSSIPSRVDTSISDIQHEPHPQGKMRHSEVHVQIPEHPIIDLAALKKKRRRVKEPDLDVGHTADSAVL